MNEEMVRYVVYAKPGHLLGWLFPWTMVGVSEDDIGFDAGYGPSCYQQGMRLLYLKIEIPLPFQFHFIPKRAEVLLPIVQKVI